MNYLTKKIIPVLMISFIFTGAALFAQQKADDKKTAGTAEEQKTSPASNDKKADTGTKEQKTNGEGKISNEELAKKTANPLADLITIQFLNYLEFNTGPEKALRNTLNFQPVIPINLGHNVNMISRTVLPIIYAEEPVEGAGDAFGLGDMLQSFFFGPREPMSGWIFGAGPVFELPTSTDDDLIMPAQFGGGPTIIVLRQDMGFTYGLMAFQIFSYCIYGDDQSLRSLTFLQPFLNYTFKTATGLVLTTETSYDWYNKQWRVPIIFAVSQLFRIGRLPMQLQVGGRYNAVRPEYGPDWGLRFQLTFLITSK